MLVIAVMVQTTLTGHSAIVMWDYPADELSTDLTFNLYETTNASLPLSAWKRLKNLPGTTLSCTVQVQPGQHFFVLTASNYLGESEFSNVASTPGNPLTVTLAFPGKNASVATNLITLRGAAGSDQGVAQVLVKLNGGGFTPAFLTSNPTADVVDWSLPLKLSAGSNTVAVKSVDRAGNVSATTNRGFFYAVPSVLKVLVKGSGVVMQPAGAPNLYVGRSYSISASPNADNLFSNWVSVANGTTRVFPAAKLVFTMQPNLTLTANFVTNGFIKAAGKYYGLFGGDSMVSPQNSGFIYITANRRQSFSGKLYVEGQVFGFAGNLDVAGRGTSQEIRRAGKPPLMVMVQLGLDGSDRIRGMVNGVGWKSPLSGNKAAANSFAGTYTMVIASQTNSVQTPAGDGYGLIRVQSSGGVVCGGSLGDGQKLTTLAAGVSRRGDWPMYGRTHRDPLTGEYKEWIIGWLQFTNRPGRDLRDGHLVWIKSPTASDAFYAAGFTNDPVVLASAYDAPPLGLPVLSVSAVKVLLQSGNLEKSLANQAVLEADNSFLVLPPNENALNSLQMFGNVGNFKGQFLHPARPGTLTQIQGAVLQDEQEIRGFFPGTNQTGAFRLEGD
jgi:hypothetical protein